MTPAERRSASRRKKKADAGQQSKTGAAKPTYVATDKPKRKTMKASFSNWRADLEQLDEGYRDDGDVIKPGDKILRKNKQTLSDNDIKRMKQGIPLDKAHYEPQGEMVEEGKDESVVAAQKMLAIIRSFITCLPSAYASALVKCQSWCC